MRDSSQDDDEYMYDNDDDCFESQEPPVALASTILAPDINSDKVLSISIPSQSPLQQPATTATSTTNKPLTNTEKCSNIFLVYDATAKNYTNVTRLKQELTALGYKLYCHDGADIATTTGGNKNLSIDIITQIKKCCVVVCAISKEYRYNTACKNISLYACEVSRKEAKNGPEVLFALTQGEYTTQSYPFRIDGWIGHMIKDCVWYPCWSSVQIAGAAEAIAAVILLKKKSFTLDATLDTDIWQDRAAAYKETHVVSSSGSPNIPKSPIVVLMDKLKKKKMVQQHTTILNPSLAFR